MVLQSDKGTQIPLESNCEASTPASWESMTPRDPAEAKPVRPFSGETNAVQSAGDVKRLNELLHDVQSLAQVGGWEYDLVNDSVHWTSGVYRILETSPAEFQPTLSNVGAFFTPETQARIEAMYGDIRQSPDEHDLELEVITARQRRIWVHSQARTLREQGRVVKRVGVIQDITTRKQAQVRLYESEQRYRTLIEWSPDAVAVHRGGKFIYANPAALTLFGAQDASEIIGHPFIDFVHVNSRAKVLERLKVPRLYGEPVPLVELQACKVDGTVIDVELRGTTVILEGEPCYHVVARDITERKRSHEQLRLAASVFSHAHEGILITDPAGSIINVNDTFSTITGFSREEVIGRNPRILNSGRHGREFFHAMWRSLREHGQWSGEIWNRRKNGEIYAEMETVSSVRDEQGRICQYVALFSDITVIKEHQDQLEHMAHYDQLTKLPNRTLLADRMKRAMTRAVRRHQRLVVVYLDLDGFKAINDLYGHAVGDQMLVAVANHMQHALRPGDTLARVGGDEFVAVLLNLPDAASSVPMLERLLGAAAQPVPVGTLSLQASASLGFTFYPQATSIDADQLVRQADHAMYQAKVAGKNRYHAFDAEQDNSLRRRHASIERLRDALVKNEFVLFYQPKVNLGTGAVIDVEALIRWQHPELGLLAPAEFLPLIENQPLATSVGEWVIVTALRQLTLWRNQGLHLPISVNVGARQLHQPDFVERLQHMLAAEPDLSAGDLMLEVLETSALEDIDMISGVIEACDKMGVTFALDDFGTGYSSLTYLKRLPVFQLKIDRSFVCNMAEDKGNLAILEGIMGLGAAFHCQVIAEGVETVEHGVLLRQMRCQLAQGYIIARPMPAADIPGWLDQWQPFAEWVELPSEG